MRIIHFEAVNFAETIFDSSDLPLIRGGSTAIALAPQELVKGLKIGEADAAVFSSTALIQSDTLSLSDIDEWIKESDSGGTKGGLDKSLRECLPYMCFTRGEGNGETFEEAWRDARQSAIEERFRRLTTMPLAESDPRKQLGKNKWRRDFYHRLCGWKDDSVQLPKSLHDLENNNHFDVPKKLSKKIAFVFFDTNGTGSVLREESFEAFVAKSQSFSKWRDSILKSLIECSILDLNEGKRQLYLETLFHGADETMLAIPAWNLSRCLDTLERILAWRDEQFATCSHSISIVVCNLKSPVRLCSELLFEMNGELKRLRSINGAGEDGEDRVMLLLVGAMGLMVSPISRALATLFDKDQDDALRFFSLSLPDLRKFLEQVNAAEGFSGSTVRRTSAVSDPESAGERPSPTSHSRRTEKLSAIIDRLRTELFASRESELSEDEANKLHFFVRYLFELRGQLPAKKE